jgi:hypothetical protein
LPAECIELLLIRSVNVAVDYVRLVSIRWWCSIRVTFYSECCIKKQNIWRKAQSSATPQKAAGLVKKNEQKEHRPKMQGHGENGAF